MAITDLGQLASGGSTATNQSSLTVTTTAAVAVGELVVVVLATPSQVLAPREGDEPTPQTVTGITIGGFALTQGWNQWSGTGSDNTHCHVYFGVVPSAYAPATNITATFVAGAAPLPNSSALTARHFSFTSADIQAANAQGTPGAVIDPPALTLLTDNITTLRIRGISIAIQTIAGASWSATAGWTGWSQGISYAAAPPHGVNQQYAAAEHIVFTGTDNTSDPAWISARNANVYIALKEVGPTGTLAATEGSDSASFSGSAGVNYGTLEAYEGAVWLTADSTLYTADDDVTRVNTAGQIRDIANFAGQVVLGVAGTLAATEATTDTAAFAGKVGLIGTLAATDGADVASFAGTVRTLATLAATEGADVASFAGTARMNAALAATENRDTAAFSGVAFFAATGTLAATEGADTAAFIGLLSESGTLAATEEADEAAFTGVITNAGVLEAVEDSPDTAVFDGEVAWTGTLEATEDTQDTAEFAGITGAIGTLAATEVGDSAQFAGYLSLVDEKVGVLNAFEDQVGGYSEPRADSTLVTADNTLFHVSIDYYGQDRAYFVGELIVGAQLVATEAADTASFVGGVAVTGVMAGFETWDIANFQGSVGDVIFGRLEAREERDTALFSEPELDIRGVLEAVEGSDIAYFTMARWEDVEEGAGLENEILRTVWLTGQGGRVVWLENEVEDTSFLQNLDPEMVSLLAEQQRITELRP